MICLDYTTELNRLHEEYGDEVTFVGYFPNFSSKPEKIEAFKEKYKIFFPLKTDYFKKMSSKYGATITPEVVVYNHTTNEKIYQGRIDNKFYKLGRRRKVVTKHELEDVLVRIRNKNTTPVEHTAPVGCYINYSDAISKYKI